MMKHVLPLSTELAAMAFMVILGGCASSLTQSLTLPNRHAIVRGQLVIHSDFPIAAHHRLVEDLAARRNDVRQLLSLPGSDEPIHVYLFDSEDQFTGFMNLHYPQFPQRRAFFLETDTRLAVYAQWGDKTAEDLRHEVTHGYLHSVVPNLPLWLDEGLAEFFEAPRGHRGFNRAHLERCLAMLQSGMWIPDLQRLDHLDPAANMGRDDYSESWAWVHFLLQSDVMRGEMLRQYLQELRRDGATTPLSQRLAQRFDCPERALIDHLRALAAKSAPGNANRRSKARTANNRPWKSPPAVRTHPALSLWAASGTRGALL